MDWSIENIFVQNLRIDLTFQNKKTKVLRKNVKKAINIKKENHQQQFCTFDKFRVATPEIYQMCIVCKKRFSYVILVPK